MRQLRYQSVPRPVVELLGAGHTRSFLTQPQDRRAQDFVAGGSGEGAREVFASGRFGRAGLAEAELWLVEARDTTTFVLRLGDADTLAFVAMEGGAHPVVGRGALKRE